MLDSDDRTDGLRPSEHQRAVRPIVYDNPPAHSVSNFAPAIFPVGLIEWFGAAVHFNSWLTIAVATFSRKPIRVCISVVSNFRFIKTLSSRPAGLNSPVACASFQS